ncbi:MAG TPA: hypothetical protein VFX16_14525 [Pseudonocardiaceae bacterium]|nr:hypothetical protein [Pseudonocardiaceae bacterium]
MRSIMRITWAESVDRNVLLRAQRILADIRIRMTVSEEVDIVEPTRTDLRTLSAVADAVVRLHSRDTDGSCRRCSRCWHRRRWPCSTIRTLSRAVDGAEMSR